MSQTGTAGAERRPAPWLDGAFSQAFLALFTASHTFDALNHFFSRTIASGAVKLTSPGGVGSWH